MTEKMHNIGLYQGNWVKAGFKWINGMGKKGALET